MENKEKQQKLKHSPELTPTDQSRRVQLKMEGGSGPILEGWLNHRIDYNLNNISWRIPDRCRG